MALTLMHLANHGSRNIGNAALILGLERVLEEDLPGDVTFAPEPWDAYSRGERTFDRTFVDRVNAECDALLVGAAVSFDGSGHYERTGFRFDLPLELWDEIRRPIVFYGLSHRVWPRREYRHVIPLRAALEHIVGSERILFAARNDGTKEWLETVLGRRSDRILVVPDPAVFVPTEAADHLELEAERINVVVALNAEDEPERWGRAMRRRSLRAPRPSRDPRDWLPVTSTHGWRESRSAFLRALASALSRLARERDAHLIMCAHDPADVGMSYELFELLDERGKHATSFSHAALPVSAGPRFYDLYDHADVVVAMRIHAMNPAIGIGAPVVPLVSQPRMSAFMEDAGLADLGVDLHEPDLDARIHAAANAALAAPAELKARLAAARARLRERAAATNALVAAHVGAA